MKTLIKFSVIMVAVLSLFSLTQESFIRTEAVDKLHVRVGTYDNKPKIYQENGETKGLFADIVNYIADREDWEIEYIHGTWAEGLERLESNEIDMMVDVAISEDRKEIYDFSNETVLINWAAIYTRPDVEVQSFYDLEGKKVAVMKSGIHYVGPLGIKSLVESFNIQDVSFIDVNLYADVFDQLDKGSVDAGIVNRVFGIYNEPDYNVVRSNVVFNPIELRFAFTKGAEKNDTLIRTIDENILRLKQNPDSAYYESLKTYLKGFHREVEVVPAWVQTLIIAGAFLAAILVTALFMARRYQKRLKATVEERTQQLEDSTKKYKDLYKDSQQKVRELEILTKAAIGRELRIKELKESASKG